MIDPMRPARSAKIALLVFFGATVAGVYFATQLRLAYPSEFRRPWSEALTINLTHYWIWGALVPVVVFLARRFRFENRGWLALPVHAAASIVLTTVELVAAGFILIVLIRVPEPGNSVMKVLQRNFHSSLPTYWLILFVYWALDYAGRAARLKASLTEARLDALKTQLNPHFLFNTLNSISSLMYTDIEAADRMMSRLSDLLRSTIQNNGAQEVTLREELEFVDRYLEIEKIRFEERLRVRVHVESEALDGLLPAFSLQPLVENAVRHGIGPLESGGSLAIEGRRANGRLVVRITDDGAGPGEEPVREGIGLTNTRARLEELYGGEASLQTGNGNGGGFFVELDMPYRTPGGVRP
jgi:two-component sensor histidine kinase